MEHLYAAFINGFFLALGLILPLGIQNSFVLNQSSLERKYWHALPIILTAAISDTTLILLAVLGVSLILMQFVWLRMGLLIFGAVFMIYVGWISWRAVYTLNTEPEKKQYLSLKQKILFTLSVSILNPYAILDTVGVIGTSSILYVGTAKIVFVTACILISWLWFFALAGFGRVLRKFEKIYRYQGKISAIIIWFNVFILLSKAKALL